MSLTGTYSYAIKVAKDFHLDGSVEERGGKLHFKGTVGTQDEANKILGCHQDHSDVATGRRR